jgi:hypothetical protein
MSLAPGDEQVLAEIEDRLRRSDLRLAARLAVFRRRATHRGRGPATGERISPWLPRRRRGGWLALLALVCSVVIAASVVLASAF